MADEIRGQRMSDYTEIDDASLTSTEKAYYKANARVTTFGKVDNGVSTPNSNYNIPLSEIAGEALPTIETGDAGKVLTVNANEDGVQWSEGSISYDSRDPIAITSYFGGDPKIELKYNSDDFAVSAGGELNLVTPVPEIGEDDNRGKFLKVADDSDELVWDTIPTAPTYTAGTGIDITSNAISVTLPVPDPGTDQHRGHVLTVNNSDDTIEWAAPQGGGGGGGNPYTKVEVTPEAAVLNGKKSSSGFVLFDQSVNIANNTLSVIPGGIGYEDRENPDEESYDIWSKAIDVFKINLPAGTDFPMAVVEFPLTPNQGASVNTIEVYVGSTKLTQIRDVPYRDDAIVGNEIYADAGMEHVTDSGSNYWKWTDIWGNNLASAKTAIVNMNNDGYTNPKVQVHIFGSCYRVMSSVQTEIVPAS